MQQLQYFRVCLESENEELNLFWKNKGFVLDIECNSELLVGDFINYSNHSENENLIKDFNTNKFIVLKREMIFDENISDPVENYNFLHLFIKPNS